MLEKLNVWTKATSLLLGVGIIAFLGSWVYRSIQVSGEVQEIATEHFIISYSGILDREAQTVADSLELNYTRLLKSLKVAEHPTVTVHLHPNQSAFDTVTGWPGAAGTSAGPRTIHISWPKIDNTVAIHEFVHTLQLNRLISYGIQAGWNDEELEEQISGSYPRWLWESVSIYLAGEQSNWGVFYYFGGDRRPSLSSYTRSNNSIYSVGYTIGEYLVAEWGEEILADLVSSFGNIEVVLGVTEEEFERGWHQYVSANYLTW